MAMKFHGNVRGKVRVNSLARFASKPHVLTRGALKLFRIVRANVRLNFAIPILFWFLIRAPNARVLLSLRKSKDQAAKALLCVE